MKTAALEQFLREVVRDSISRDGQLPIEYIYRHPQTGVPVVTVRIDAASVEQGGSGLTKSAAFLTLSEVSFSPAGETCRYCNGTGRS